MSKRPRGEEEAAAAAPPPKKRRGRPRKAEQQGVPYRLTCVHLCQSGALFFGEGGARKCATCMEHWDDSEREWRRHPERQCTRADHNYLVTGGLKAKCCPRIGPAGADPILRQHLPPVTRELWS
jgi:hypothetical protein